VAKTEVADPEKLLIERFDQATNSLMASLHESKALNNQIKKALNHQQQADVAEPSEATRHLSTGLLQLLSNIIDGGKVP
jgi:hypothetical protein